MKQGKILQTLNFKKSHSWVQEFEKFDTVAFERLWRTAGERFWRKEGEKRALAIFHEAARRVPAYQDFLRRHKVRPARIKTIKDFGGIPPTDKQNYIKAYPLEDRMWNGQIAKAKLVAVSSGTTGEPKFWPRGDFQEFEAAVIHELLYRSFFDLHQYPTLVLIGFPIGVYVSGIATLLPTLLAVTKISNRITVMPIGNNKSEMLRTIKYLRDDYEQILLIGHPFFLKDVIETGKTEGIPWSRKRIRMMCCSEGFSERWRRYVMREAGCRPAEHAAALNTYGSSELLLMAYETPLTLFIRNLMDDNKSFREQLIGQIIVPSLFQYNPFLRYVETLKQDFLFTSASGIPLIRFNLKDSGRLISFSEMTERLNSIVPGWQTEYKSLIHNQPTWQLPFITLSGRSDHTVIFYAANIYPEHIHSALHEETLFKKLTGKFTIRKDYRKDMDEYLEINIELRPKIRSNDALQHLIQEQIIRTLQKVNMEYLFLWNNLDKDLKPRVKLWPYQHKKYFQPGLKPRYIHQS